MPKSKLTKAIVERLPAPDPSGKQQLHWDSALTGLAVLCSGVTSAKSYVVQRDIGGKSRRITIAPTNVIDLDEARNRAKAILSEMYRGKDPKAFLRGDAKATLRQVLEDFLTKRHDLRSVSQRDYRVFIENYLTDWLDRPMVSITPEMAEERHAAIVREITAREAERRRAKGLPAIDSTRPPGQTTANLALQTLKVLWNFQRDRLDKEFPEDPTHRLIWFPTTRRDRTVPVDRLPDFYKAVDSLENRTAGDLIKLLMFTGMRRTEASSLKWENVDFGSRVIRIPGAITKSGRPLDLPMSDFVFNLLVGRRSIGRDTADYVFPGDGKSGYLADPGQPFAQIAEKCGVRVSSHDLRRLFVSVAATSGIGVYQLKRLVNHAVGADVTAGYFITDIEQLREAAQKVAERLCALCGIAAKPDGQNVAVIAR